MSSVTPGQRFTPSHPCPVCRGSEGDPRGEGRRCFGYRLMGDGSSVCTREDHSGGLPHVAKVSGYIHSLDRLCKCGRDHRSELPVAPRSPNRTNGHGRRRERGTVTRYEIRDEAGNVVAVHGRKDFPDGRKRMWWEQPDGTPGLGGRAVTDLPLYGAEDLAKAPPGASVVVTEGEKAREALKERGVLAVGTVTGAKATPNDGVLRVLLEHPTTLWPDNDEKGASLMRRINVQLAAMMHGHVRMLAWAEAPPKGDAYDFFAGGGTAEEARAMIAAAPHLDGAAGAIEEAIAGPAAQGAAVWTRAKTAAELLEAGAADVEWLDFPLVARGAITQINAPRGTGKSIVVLARMVALAASGVRVLYLDRDNSPATLRKRLRGLGAYQVPTLRVLTRDEAPPLLDRAAWAAFPLGDFDVVVLDAWDSFAEGVGEQDSRRSTLALAPLLDVVRRERAPGVIMLGNVTKDGVAGRGSGTLEDRADVVYEARDTTGFAPSGRKPWWEELPPAARREWASRATRRADRARPDRIRVAFVCSKFRDEDDPAPFALEADFTSEPWSVRDVTSELVSAGDSARAAELADEAAARSRAADALVAELVRLADTGGAPLLTKPAEALLAAHGLRRQAARELLKSGGAGRWRLELRDGRSIAVLLLASSQRTAEFEGTGSPHEQHRFALTESADRHSCGRPNLMAAGAAKNAAILPPEIRPPSPLKPADDDGIEL